jgi:polyisoprenoid-binding protein YceI
MDRRSEELMAREQWDIDPSHSSIGFVVKHMVFAKVRGGFDKFTGVIDADPHQPEQSSVTATIEAASINTREAQRDAHLRSPDFLDAGQHPQIEFRSKKVIGGQGDRFKVVGDLTIRGTTREVALDAERTGMGKDPWGKERAGFAARTSLDRKDYGLKWNQLLEAGGVLVGDRVDIEIEVEAVKRG